LFCGSALGLALAISAPASVAFAQDAAVVADTATADEAQATNDGTGQEASEVEGIVVVGSRIRHDTYNTPAPVTVITREETTLAGFASTTEALQQSTAVTGGTSQINNAYGGYVTDGGPGANTIGLRGLGPGRTLVLMNGRRVAPAGSRGSVGTADLNVLPSAMLERVEILRDGASSVYGSDAIGGVVNLITRKNIDGLEVEGQYTGTENGGGEQTRLSIVAGRAFLDDRLTLNGSLEYYEREDLTLGDRDWTRCNQDYFYNPDGSRADYIDPTTGKPKCYPITATGSNGVTINTIGTQAIGGRNRFRPDPFFTGGPLPGFEPVTLASRDTFEDRMLNQSLISPTKVYTGYLNGTYELNALGDAEVYFEVLANRRESEQTGYRQLSLDYATGSPLLPAGFLSTSDQGAPTDITNGQNLGVRAFVGFGNDLSTQDVDFYRTTAGIRGDLGGFLSDWKYDAYASYSRSEADYMFQAFLIDRLSQSLDVVSDGAGGFNCADPSGGCIAAPALSAQVVAGQLPADWVDYVWRDVTGSTIYDESVVSASIDGPLFELPAGEVQAVFGVEYRHASIDDTPGIDSQTGNLLNFTSSAVTRGSDSVTEAFTEVEVPILRDLPFAQALTVNASARYTNYDSYGDDWTYKIGAVFAPTDWLSFRSTYGTSYRAPALFEQFQGGSTGFFDASADPCSFDNIGPAGGIREANCIAEGIPAGGFQPTSGVTVVTAGGAAQGLEAETSENFTAGLILKPDLPDMFGKLAIAIDYYNIEIDNGVSRVGAGAILDLCYDDPQFRTGGGYCRFIDPREAGSNALTIYDSYTNIATQMVEGIDYNVRWTGEVGPGDLLVNANVTQYLTQQSRLFSTDPFDDVNGTLTSPEYTASFDAVYHWDKWNVRYGFDWIAGQDSSAYLGIPGGRNGSGYDFKVPSYFMHSASVQYRADDWTATAGVRNLFDETPPIISAGAYSRVGNAPLYSGYDYVGRSFFVNVSKRF
jgi:outer membrane receptor protein involved in Fe transport